MRLSGKGQEEAPIELLIGVVIFAFVLVIGFYVYDTHCGAQFEQKMLASSSHFARELESVYRGAVGTKKTISVDFSVEGCANAQLDRIAIVKGPQDSCESSIGRSDCLIFIMTSTTDNDVSRTPIIEPIDIPSWVRVTYEPCKDVDDNAMELHAINIINGKLNVHGVSSVELAAMLRQCTLEFERYVFEIEKRSSDEVYISRK